MSTTQKRDKWIQVAREVFPDMSESDLISVMWSHTGFPGFFAPDPGETVRDVFLRQLRAYRDGTCTCEDCDPQVTEE